MPDFSLSGLRVIRELETIMAVRGKPATIVSDNGTVLTRNAVLRWAADQGIEWHYIALGKPMQNGFVESFNGRMTKPEPPKAALPAVSLVCLLGAGWDIDTQMQARLV